MTRNCNLLLPGQEEAFTLLNIKFPNLFLIMWLIFALLNPDPDFGSGFRIEIP
jgi:hypothetical protein